MAKELRENAGKELSSPDQNLFSRWIEGCVCNKLAEFQQQWYRINMFRKYGSKWKLIVTGCDTGSAGSVLHLAFPARHPCPPEQNRPAPRS